MNNAHFFRHFAQIAQKLYNPLLLLFWIFMLYGSDSAAAATSTLICILAHEGAHVIAFLYCGRLTIPRARINGLKISLDYISYKKNLFATAIGPLTNIIFSLLFAAFAPIFSYAASFALINLMTAVSNLIPVSGTDGYNLISVTLRRFNAPRCAYLILDTVSVTLNVLIFLISSYCVLRVGEGYWIWGVFLISVIRSLETFRSSFF